MAADISDSFQRRYARHIVLSEVGLEGQQKLAASSVLVVGAGGLGAAAIGSLAAMGVGRIGIMDDDRVELSNLQRQTLYETRDIGRLKAEAAADRVEELNPECKTHIHAQRFTAETPPALLRDYLVVLDCTDHFAARFALHAACFKAQKPLISAAISAFSGQISTFKAYLGAPHPCYHCWVAETPAREITCAQEGIIGALAGIMGGMQALEAVKERLGIGASLSGKLLIYESLAGVARMVLLPRDPSCHFCGAEGVASRNANA